MFWLPGPPQHQNLSYDKHTYEGVSHKNNKNIFFWATENLNSPLQPAKMPVTKTCNLGHEVLPPRGENQKYLQWVRVTHPNSTYRTLIFPPGVFRFRKNDCYEQGPNILTLWPEFSQKARDAWNLTVKPWCASRHFLVFLMPAQPKDPSCCLS